MTAPLVLLVTLCWATLALTWIVYPIWLHFHARSHARPRIGGEHVRWPSVTIVVVVHNAEAKLRSQLENLVALAYPRELRRILVVSNGATDFTDAIARLYSDSGVDLLRITRPRRQAAIAENIARRYVDTELVVVLRPAARLRPSALAALVGPFADPTVGVAYGREISAELTEQGARIHRSLYGRYEAWLRDRETTVFGTVSARASLYAVRGELFRVPVSATLSPDFAPILTAREQGFRAVYAPEAECVVMRERSLKGEYARKVQAVARDVSTLLMKPHLLDPRRYGAFAWFLLGHKLGRWLTPWALLVGIGGVMVLAPAEAMARGALALALAVGLDAAVVWGVPAHSAVGRLAAFPGRVAATGVAMAHALVRALREEPELQLEVVRHPRFPYP